MSTTEPNGNAVDINKMTDTMEPQQSTGGGLLVPGNNRVVLCPPEKYRLGLDALALAKRVASNNEGKLKVPRESVTSIVSSLEEEENSSVTDMDGVEALLIKAQQANLGDTGILVFARHQ